MTKQILLDEISKSMKAVRPAHDAALNKSFTVRVDNLRPGDPAPIRGRFYDAENKAAFNSQVDELKAQAISALRLYENDYAAELAAPPSETATRAINTFARLKPFGENDPEYKYQLDVLLKAYGSNPLAHEAIRSAARENGVKTINPHPAIKRRHALQDVEKNINTFFDNVRVPDLADRSTITEGYAAFTVGMIDDLLDET